MSLFLDSLYALVLTGCFSKPAATPPAGDAARPDVILLSVDTLRPDHLGAWGYERPTSPFFDELAGRGVRFESAWAPSPWTLPSHATMLTGLLPHHHGAVEDDLALPNTAPYLPATFKDAGYATGAVVATLYVSRRYGFERSFDHFDDFDIRGERQNLKKSPDAEDVFERALIWGSTLPAGKPVFLFLHVYDVHYPYEAPSPYAAKFDRPTRKGDAAYKNYAHHLESPLSAEQMAHQVAQYDEEIAYVDASFRKFIAEWTQQRQAVIAITSDHGEEFGERGSWGHGHTLWPEQLRVPWIVSGAGVQPSVVTRRVGLEDVAPTLAGFAGLPFPAGDGADRAHALRGRPAAAPSGVAAQLGDTSRFETLRYRWHMAPYDLYLDLHSGERALCDLARDPRCTTDLYAQLPTEAEAAEQAFWALFGEPWKAPTAVTVRTDGALRQAGVLATGRVPVEAGASFLILPIDARVAAEAHGPWRIAAGKRPTPGQSLEYTGPAPGAGAVTLEAGEKKLLETLGYVQ